MFRNSSISAFKAYADPAAGSMYVKFVIAVVATVLVTNVALALIAIRFNLLSWQFASLFKYQIAKLESGPPIDILLVGDSSLGNAIDANWWSRKDNLVVVNVALTGAYGYAGSLQMLRRAAHNRGVKKVLVVQASDMMTRDISHEGALFSAETLDVLRDLPPAAVMPWLLSKDLPINMLEQSLNRKSIDGVKSWEADYVAQGAPKKSFDRVPVFTSAMVKPDKTYYLARLVAFCREFGIECYYAHGPLVSPLCVGSNEYFSRANDLIEKSGIRVLTLVPLCVPLEEIGDSSDHVRPAYKLKYTAIYRSLLKSY